MTSPTQDPPDGGRAPIARSRDEMRRIAAHVLARAQYAATGRLGLRPTPGGFGTITFGDRLERVRTSGTMLVRETASPDGTRSYAVEMEGATLADLAGFAGADLDADLAVGRDTPSLGDADAPIRLDRDAVAVLAEWFAVGSSALDRVVRGSPAWSAPSHVQLWPEHFDVALDVAFDPAVPFERRVNLGASPGDGFHDEPYLYVGPWTDDRPGDPAFWNAPFGAVLGREEVVGADDPIALAAAFFGTGVALLTRGVGG